MTALAPDSRTSDARGTARIFAELGHGASAGRLPGGNLFLQHGPVNLVVDIQGTQGAIARAERQLLDAFPHWLGHLVAVLPQLRTATSSAQTAPADPIAAAMVAAVRPYASTFITPMAAVAGAIADAAIEVIKTEPLITRALVNNGGDIALHLSESEAFTVGIVSDAHAGHIGAKVQIEAATPVRGIATSGWRGRSHSFGVADAITVLAPTAVQADAAATCIASATDTQDTMVKRAPANTLDDNTDLGSRLVTTNVGPLTEAARTRALDSGAKVAKRALRDGHICAAALCVQGQWRLLGAPLEDVVDPSIRPMTLSCSA